MCMPQQLRHVRISLHVRKHAVLLGNDNAFVLFYLDLLNTTLPADPPFIPSFVFPIRQLFTETMKRVLSTWRTAASPLLTGVFLGLPVTSSPQVVIRVMATGMIKHQEEEEGSKQCGGLWCRILLLLPLQKLL